MNRTLNNLIMITIGAAIGSVVTWKFVKTKYETIADEEIRSMRQYYEDRELTKAKTDVEKVEERLDEVNENAKKAAKEYIEYARRYSNQQENEEVEMVRPYVITPEEFADSDYATETLTYYADGVIEDDHNVIWDDDEVEEVLGDDFASNFGVYELDSVYVRNENKEIDYEILRDTRKKWGDDC